MLPNVAFICVHNSCRSQMAEALAKHFASDIFTACSAGTETKPRINPDAVQDHEGIIPYRHGRNPVFQINF